MRFKKIRSGILSLLSVSVIGSGVFSAYGSGNLLYAQETVEKKINIESSEETQVEDVRKDQTEAVNASGQATDLQADDKSDSQVSENTDKSDESVQPKSYSGVSATSPTENKLTASIKNGFYKEGNNWVYYSGGKAITSGEDIVQGTINGEHGWWYIKNGKAVLNKTSVEHNANGWWYVKDGKVDFGYTGFAKNVNGWWYIENGQVTFKKNDVILGTVNGQSGWWNVKGSKVLFNESIEPNISGWWYIKNGKVDFTKTGVEHNANGWWYVKDGKVDFGYTGFAKNANGWWYIENGQVTFKKNDVILGTVNGQSGWWNVKGSKVLFNESIEPNISGWWYIKNGKVDFTKTGVEHNANGWWYVKDGKVDFGYTGFAKNVNGWWYIENGQVTFKKNDVILGTVNGESGWWNVKNSQVVFNDTVEQNRNGWWYIDDGKVDFSFSGLGANSNGTWSIVNGKVDFSQNGWKKIDGYTYYLQGGKRASGVLKLGEEYYYLGDSGVLACNYSGKYGNADLKTNNSGVITSIDYPVKTWINQLNYYGCYPMACGAAATFMALQANGYAEELSGEAGWYSYINAYRAVRGSSYGKRYGNGVMTAEQVRQCVLKNSKTSSVPMTVFTGSNVNLQRIKDCLAHGQTISAVVKSGNTTHWIAITGWYLNGNDTVYRIADSWPKDGKASTNYVTHVTRREDASYSDRLTSSDLGYILKAPGVVNYHDGGQMLVIGNYK